MHLRFHHFLVFFALLGLSDLSFSQSQLSFSAEFNLASAGLPKSLWASDPQPKTPQSEEQNLARQLVELTSLKNKVSNMDTNTRVSATHRVWTIGLTSTFSEVKMLALDLLEEPAGSASDHIRMPAVYAIAEIANSTEDVQVKLKALAKLRESLQASQVPIRDVAIDAVNLIAGSTTRGEIALAAVRELGAPISSGNNAVRIPAINSVVKVLESSTDDAVFNAALDLLVAPLESGALIGGIEVRMMAVAAVEKLGLKAPETRTKTKAMILLQNYAAKSAWETEAKARAQEAAAKIQASIK